ncbi:MAG: TRAP transporter substrate-binding protein DctP [Pseudomonadota bacterium]|nr:TRAP transporter substrate-binding protein DctP [Pseudomonadota bacterium]
MKTLSKLVTGSALALACTAGAGLSQDLRYAAFVGTQHPSLSGSLEPMFERISEATDGEMNFTVFPLGQLLGARAILGGIEDGIADGGMIVPHWYPSEIPSVTNYANMAVYGTDPFAIAGAVNEAMLLNCPECVNEYADAGARILGAYSTTPFVLQCTTPVDTLADLEGLRVKTTGIMGPRLERLNAVPSNIPSPEMAEGLQRNQLDCVLASMDWYTSYGLDGIVTDVTEAPLGTVRAMSLMAFSNETWDRLTEDRQDLLLKEITYAVADMMIAQDALATQSKNNAEASGVTFHQGDETLVAALAPSAVDEELIAEYAANVGVENYAEQIDAFRAALEKWEGIIGDIGHDREAFAQALWDEVYSKLE